MARTRVIIGLSAVAITAREDGGPQVLVTGQGGIQALPFGSFDPDGHRTFELAVRDFVSSQTGLALGWVEQLYTFGDKGREAPRAETGADMALSDRVVSVGYLALELDTNDTLYVIAIRRGCCRRRYRLRLNTHATAKTQHRTY